MLADERRFYVLDKFVVIDIYGEASASPVMLLLVWLWMRQHSISLNRYLQ